MSLIKSELKRDIQDRLHDLALFLGRAKLNIQQANDELDYLDDLVGSLDEEFEEK